jgi:hypothetical protein
MSHGLVQFRGSVYSLPENFRPFDLIYTPFREMILPRTGYYILTNAFIFSESMAQVRGEF